MTVTKTKDTSEKPLTMDDDKGPKHDKRVVPIDRHKILREVFRHFTEFQDWVSTTGESVIEHGYFLYDENYEDKIVGKVLVTISYWDLYDSLQRVAERKREAVYYNVIKDMRQKDVAEIMGITTVSVGQYVKQAMIQMSEDYFGEDGERIEYVR